jgi:hypothetical protein
MKRATWRLIAGSVIWAAGVAHGPHEERRGQLHEDQVAVSGEVAEGPRTLLEGDAPAGNLASDGLTGGSH